MLSEQQTVSILETMAAEMPGYMAAALVDLESGMTLGTYSKDDSFDLSAAGAYNSELVKQKQKVMSALRLDSDLEDMLITLSDQIHLIRLVTPTTFIYLAADRSASNLAIVRTAVSRYSDQLAG